MIILASGSVHSCVSMVCLIYAQWIPRPAEICLMLMRCWGIGIYRSQQRTIVNCMSINEDNVMVSAGVYNSAVGPFFFEVEAILSLRFCFVFIFVFLKLYSHFCDKNGVQVTMEACGFGIIRVGTTFSKPRLLCNLVHDCCPLAHACLLFSWWGMTRTTVVMLETIAYETGPSFHLGNDGYRHLHARFSMYGFGLLCIGYFVDWVDCNHFPAVWEAYWLYVFVLQVHWIARPEFMPFHTIRRALDWSHVKQTRLSNFGKKMRQLHQKHILSTSGRRKTCAGSDRAPPI